MDGLKFALSMPILGEDFNQVLESMHENGVELY